MDSDPNHGKYDLGRSPASGRNCSMAMYHRSANALSLIYAPAGGSHRNKIKRPSPKTPALDDVSHEVSITLAKLLHTTEAEIYAVDVMDVNLILRFTQQSIPTIRGLVKQTRSLEYIIDDSPSSNFLFLLHSFPSLTIFKSTQTQQTKIQPQHQNHVFGKPIPNNRTTTP